MFTVQGLLLIINETNSGWIFQRTFGQNDKNIKPTFGISFGLPQQGGGGYAINPLGPNPFVNPYGGAIGGGGINLGLVSVNPLVSVQVTKDDYGEKIVKPFINLHVTPNDYLVHKANRFLSHKKGLILNNHYHHYNYPKPPYAYGYGHGFHHKPIHYDGDAYLDHPPFPIKKIPPYHHFNHQPHFEHYEEPFHNHDGFEFSRAVNYSQGNNLNDQYQEQYNNGQNYYKFEPNQNLDPNYQVHENDQNYDHFVPNARNDRKLNPIKFPTSRKRRDVNKVGVR